MTVLDPLIARRNQIPLGRTLFAFLTVVAIVLPRTGLAVLRTNRYREHLQRGLSQFGSMLCWFLAVSVLSLGSATAIGFAAPLFTTLLTLGALFALGNAVLISTVAIAIRRMSMTESTETLTLYQMSIMTVCTACLLTLGFRAPHWADALMVALAGISASAQCGA